MTGAMDAFKTYLEKIAEQNLKPLGLLSLRFRELTSQEEPVPTENSKAGSGENEIVLPIKFNGNPLGVLEAKSKLVPFDKRVHLEDLSAQVACLFQNKNRTQAIALDKLVESLALAHSDRYHWTGVYLLNSSNLLELAAFRGESTPHMVIPIDRGICGAAVREGKTLNIPDVHLDSRYLSCSIKTKSEIVVPIFKGEKVIGEIDIDSHLPNAFTSGDEKELKEYAALLSEIL